MLPQEFVADRAGIATNAPTPMIEVEVPPTLDYPEHLIRTPESKSPTRTPMPDADDEPTGDDFDEKLMGILDEVAASHHTNDENDDESKSNDCSPTGVVGLPNCPPEGQAAIETQMDSESEMEDMDEPGHEPNEVANAEADPDQKLQSEWTDDGCLDPYGGPYAQSDSEGEAPLASLSTNVTVPDQVRRPALQVNEGQGHTALISTQCCACSCDSSEVKR